MVQQDYGMYNILYIMIIELYKVSASRSTPDCTHATWDMDNIVIKKIEYLDIWARLYAKQK
jgi:hypothetical protein